MIHNLDAYVHALWNWDCLDGCFGDTLIKVGDIDGIVERNGHFLLIEAKGNDKQIGKGQRILLDHLVDIGCFSTLVVWGKPQEPTAIELTTEFGKRRMYRPADIRIMREIVSSWFRFAEAGSAGRGFAVRRTG